MCERAPIDAKASEKVEEKTDWAGLLAIHNTTLIIRWKLNADSSQNFLNGISLHVTSVFSAVIYYYD